MRTQSRTTISKTVCLLDSIGLATYSFFPFLVQSSHIGNKKKNGSAFWQKKIIGQVGLREAQIFLFGLRLLIHYLY